MNPPRPDSSSGSTKTHRNFLKKSGTAGSLALFIALIVYSPWGLAHQKGDMLVRAGAAYIDPSVNSDPIKLEGIELGEVGVESVTVPLLTFSYFSSEHLAFEILLGMPPKFDIAGTSGLLKNVDIGKIEAYPLVVTAQYYPMDAQSRWQPFVAAGFNYVIPGDTEVNPDLAPLFGADSIELEVAHSWGLVLSLGLDFMIRENMTVSAEAYYMDIKGEADGEIIIDGQSFDIDLFARTDRVPVLYSLTLGYVF